MFYKSISSYVVIMSMWLPMATMAQKAIVPLMEMQGRTCFGYFRVTERYLDFYTPFLDCHRMKYSNIEQSKTSIQVKGKTYNSLSMSIDSPSKDCPFAVVEILSYADQMESKVRQIIAYPNKESFENQRWGIDQSTGEDNRAIGELSCAAYPVEATQRLQIKPENKRVKPQVR